MARPAWLQTSQKTNMGHNLFIRSMRRQECQNVHCAASEMVRGDTTPPNKLTPQDIAPAIAPSCAVQRVRDESLLVVVQADAQLLDCLVRGRQRFLAVAA